MSIHRPESSLAFLLGAGFSVDAATEAGLPGTTRYPLMPRLAKACFGLDEVPHGKSVEELFQEAIDAGNNTPLDVLSDLIMEADWSITPRLLPGGVRGNNVYLQMLRDFEAAPILTFNYDALVEILLLNLGKWRPDDGYGVTVQAKIPGIFLPERLPPIPVHSSRPVLHLHGSLCIYVSRTYIENRAGERFDLLKRKSEPEFIFNPDSLGGCFIPFDGPSPDYTFQDPSERIIAPVPDKARGLQGEFIVQVYKLAVEIVCSSRTIVSIGYSFNGFDQGSYTPLLQAARGARVILVVPEAQDLAARLTQEYPAIEWTAVPLTFRDWVSGGYAGVMRS